MFDDDIGYKLNKNKTNRMAFLHREIVYEMLSSKWNMVQPHVKQYAFTDKKGYYGNWARTKNEDTEYDIWHTRYAFVYLQIRFYQNTQKTNIGVPLHCTIILMRHITKLHNKNDKNWSTTRNFRSAVWICCR